MSKITLDINISKARVLDEVAKTAAYIGKKSTNEQDAGAYDRISAVDADREQLDRYWMESCASVNKAMDHWVAGASDQRLTHHAELDRDFITTLKLPSNWNSAYTNTVSEVITAYLIDSIVSHWLMLVGHKEAPNYGALAAALLDQLQNILLSRKRPVRRNSETEEDSNLWGGPQLWNN